MERMKNSNQGEKNPARSGRKHLVSILNIGLILFLLLSVILAIFVGSVNIEPKSIFRIIVGKIFGGDLSAFDPNQVSIIWSLRFPKVLVAGFVGAGLALAGILMQAFTKNPLADPYILGISSGASSGAVFSLLIGSLPLIGHVPLAWSAFLGGMIAAGLVFLLGRSGTRINTTKMVLVGMATSAFFSSVTSVIIFLTPDARRIYSATFWLSGSFSGVKWENVPLVGIVFALCFFLIFPLTKEMDALLLGEDVARNTGVHVVRTKWILLLVSTMLTAVLVSVSGVIGFVGFVIPHISRSIVGASHRRLIAFSLPLSATFMIWTDLLARTVASPREIPVGVVTAFCGAPVFLWMLYKSRYSFNK